MRRLSEQLPNAIHLREFPAVTETQGEMVLLVEAPLDEAKLLRDEMQAKELRVALVKPGDCGKKS